MDTRLEDGPDAASGEVDPGAESLEAHRPREDFRPVVAMLAAFAGFYFFATTRLVRGDVLNSYPFLSDDGYDWLLEGFAVSRWIDRIPIPELPSARSPGFVGLIFSDYQIGSDGNLLFAVISLAVFTSLAVMLLLARWERIPRYQVAGIVLVFAVSPLGYFRNWILSDQIATALMVLAAVALYPYVTRGSWRWLVVATVAAALGGITQLYAMMPFLVVGGWCLGVSVWRRKPDFRLAAALVVATVTSLVLVKVWLARVPHAGVPNQLRQIRFDFDMFDFYANAWSFAFAPLLPLLIVLAIYRWREVVKSPVLAGYWLAVLAFAGSTFFYHVKDFRLTTPTAFMLGLAIVATLPGERPLPRPRELILGTVILAVFVGIFLAPFSYWRPRWSEVEFDTSNNYIARLLSSEPRDRFKLGLYCDSNTYCPEVRIRPLISGFRRTRIEIYRYLASADSSTPLAAYFDQIYDGVLELRNINDCCEPASPFPHGSPGGLTVVGDWDGLPRHNNPGRNTGADTPGVFRAGVWMLRNSNTEGPADMEFLFGETGDVPVAGDWNADGIDTIGVFRDGRWSLRHSTSSGPADLDFVFGESGDIPLVGDWNGDGFDGIGVFRDGRWLLRNTTDAGPADITFNFGAARDRPVAGDWDGDGVDTVGVFTDGFWGLRNSNAGGEPDLEFSFGSVTDQPITGDWNNDGVDTVGISG